MHPQLATPAPQAPVPADFEQTQPVSCIAFPAAFGIVLRKTATAMASPYVFRLHAFLTRNAGAWSESEDLFGWSCARQQVDVEWICRKLEQSGLQRGVDFVQTGWPGAIFPEVSWLQAQPLSGLIEYLG